MEDTKFQCTKCGQIGSVGRCCGLDTRTPLNDAARAESERMRVCKICKHYDPDGLPQVNSQIPIGKSASAVLPRMEVELL